MKPERRACNRPGTSRKLRFESNRAGAIGPKGAPVGSWTCVQVGRARIRVACIPRPARLEKQLYGAHLRTKRAGLEEPEKPNKISYLAGRTGLEPTTSGRNPAETQGSDEVKFVSRCIPTSPIPPAARSAVRFGGTQSTGRDQFGLGDSEDRPTPLKRHPTPSNPGPRRRTDANLRLVAVQGSAIGCREGSFRRHRIAERRSAAPPGDSRRQRSRPSVLGGDASACPLELRRPGLKGSARRGSFPLVRAVRLRLRSCPVADGSRP